jgi:hypothetical protein
MEEILDLDALRVERTAMAKRVAAIDRILHAVAALNGSSPVTGAQSGHSNGSGRQRRTNQEVDDIKAAVATELAGMSGTKNDRAQRLQDKGILISSRRDRELVLRTLKEFVDSGAATMVDDIYEAASSSDPELNLAAAGRSDSSFASWSHKPPL